MTDDFVTGQGSARTRSFLILTLGLLGLLLLGTIAVLAVGLARRSQLEEARLTRVAENATTVAQNALVTQTVLAMASQVDRPTEVATIPPSPTAAPPTDAPQLTDTPVVPQALPTATATAGPTGTSAATPEVTATPAEITYTVQSGDTLHRIAQAYGITWQEIAEANGIADPRDIFPGQVLIIPVSPTPTPGGQTIHVVQYGETLNSIAQRYGVTLETLAEANGLAAPYTIYAGQSLIIPAPTP